MAHDQPRTRKQRMKQRQHSFITRLQQKREARLAKRLIRKSIEEPGKYLLDNTKKP